jgi:hypothetical protein
LRRWLPGPWRQRGCARERTPCPARREQQREATHPQIRAPGRRLRTPDCVASLTRSTGNRHA